MNARKIMVFFVLVAFLMDIAIALNPSDDVSESRNIKATLINQEPDPVAPGNTVEAKFRIENYGSTAAENMEIKLVLKYPFSFYGDEKQAKGIGTIAGRQTVDLGIREKWKLFVDQNAATGSNTIEFWHRINNGDWVKAGDYTLTVRTRDAVLAINEIKTEKESITPGTAAKVSFMLQNLASNTLTNIKLNLGILTTITTTSSVTYRELPFTPIGSGNEKTLDSLEPGKTKYIDFNLFTDADAQSKVYKVPYTLSYSDSAGQNFTRTGLLGLVVDAEPELSVNIDSTDIYSAGKKGKVSIKLVNKGFSDIKFLDVRLSETKDIQIISNPEVYIGKLDSDDYESADYTLLVSKSAAKQISLPLKIDYRDANGQLYTKEISLNLKLFSGAELKQRANGGGNLLVGFVILIVIVGGGLLFWRWRKKKKKLK
jgi:hypothetical protein